MSDEYVVKVVPKTTYTFTNLQNGTSQTIVLASEIEADAFAEVDLLARLHTGTVITTPATQSFAFQILAHGKTYDDPTLLFSAFVSNWNTPTTALTYPVLGTASAGVQAGAPFGTHVMVTLTATQSNPSGPLVAVCSVDLVFKQGSAMDLKMRKGSFVGYRT